MDSEIKMTFPYSIENFMGEKLVFQRLEGEDGDRLIVESFVTPGSGPMMHTHWLQDESLTVLEGRMGYIVMGQPERYAAAGETVVFKRGVAHRFWNAGAETLHCEGWIQPVNSFPFFISSIFAAQNKARSAQPEKFDAAYLLTRYASEFDLPEMPAFVKKLVIPTTFRLGKLLGKYRKFKAAPEPVNPLA